MPLYGSYINRSQTQKSSWALINDTQMKKYCSFKMNTIILGDILYYCKCLKFGLIIGMR